MMDNVNVNHLQNIHSIEGKQCDVKMCTCDRECDSSAEVTGKRKGSYLVERENDIECATGGDIWKERTSNNIKRQCLGLIEGINNETSDVICDLQVASSTPSSFVCTRNADRVMSEYEFCEEKDLTSLPVIQFNTYQVCNETLDISSTKNDLILPVDKQDCLTHSTCSTVFKEESKANNNNGKQVRFSHAVNIIPDKSVPTCTSICHSTAKLSSERDSCTNKNESGRSLDVFGDICCSTSSCKEVNVYGNMSSSINQLCVCQHSDRSVVQTRRQMFEDMPHNFEKKTDIFVARNNSFPSIDAQAKTSRCSICFVTFTDQKVAHPATCSHKFCLDCLQQWAKHMNTCPMDRLRFNTIFVKDCLNGKIVDHIPVKNCELEDDDMDNDVDYCEVCRLRSIGREEILISCYRCGRMYHLTCLSSPIDIVTFENWVCPDCEDC